MGIEVGWGGGESRMEWGWRLGGVEVGEDGCRVEWWPVEVGWGSRSDCGTVFYNLVF